MVVGAVWFRFAECSEDLAQGPGPGCEATVHSQVPEAIASFFEKGGRTWKDSSWPSLMGKDRKRENFKRNI